MKRYFESLMVKIIVFLMLLANFLWSLELRRLIRGAAKIGWDVEFVDAFAGDAGRIYGQAVHAQKLIRIRRMASAYRMVQVLRHELEHAHGAEYARAIGWLTCGGTFGALASLVSLTVETVAGSTLSVSTIAPSTYDAAGYGSSLLNWVVVGELTDLGQGFGRAYNLVTHAPIASAQQQQKKGSYTLAAIDMMCGWDQNDSGQDILRTAGDDNSVISVRVTKQNGHVRYFTAQVSKFVENHGTVDNIVVGSFTLLPQTNFVPYPA